MDEPKPTLAEEVEAYLAQLNPREKAALAIAPRILFTSFDLVKSNGFLAWKKKQTQPK
jgi:hypothetical protein